MTTDHRPTDHRGRFVPDGSWPPGRGAPEPLERVRRFLNTANPESGADHFETPASLAGWMAREGYDRAGAVTGAQWEEVVALRAALRGLALANHDGALAAEDAAMVDAIAARCPVLIRLSPAAGAGAGRDRGGRRRRLRRGLRLRGHGRGHLESPEGVPQQPLPLGRSTTTPRTASGAWCSTKACGSRMKVRAYRARQRAAAGIHPDRPPISEEP